MTFPSFAGWWPWVSKRHLRHVGLSYRNRRTKVRLRYEKLVRRIRERAEREIQHERQRADEAAEATRKVLRHAATATVFSERDFATHGFRLVAEVHISPYMFQNFFQDFGAREREWAIEQLLYDFRRQLMSVDIATATMARLRAEEEHERIRYPGWRSWTE
jgi:hypothetical protein